MSFMQTRDGTSLYYNDVGNGRPVVLIHGWPLSSDSWEYQLDALVNAGFRVISYDRRGFGRSDQPWYGYDYDTLADDLADLMVHLEVWDAALIGFSMGSGEVARYLGRHGSSRVSQAAIISGVTPFLMRTSDNPSGIERTAIQPLHDSLRQDRFTTLSQFATGLMELEGKAEEIAQASRGWFMHQAMAASRKATLDAAEAWFSTDFREDLATIDVPTLILHGDNDKGVPVEISGRAAAKLIRDATYVEFEGQGHALTITHREAVNAELLNFLASKNS
ncbi:alpha/beta hydrolase [Ensifer adhaerens]|uniref:alpha/beta fold hydrolase n=1 Tax=Ensifer adhaerens TaxID=106592 RepID=UPI001CBBDE4B|nr:alpha/beta hydrolase [Ensifer adhaerens]MBZ7927760.1 alpha/beta hydrolase [Ensifer adhaerens]UAX96603.1 alpha/beta hydrolase [Ensifer adhaerens]UAY04053.1 alpha/beta hydrolase [Ensifer adhaerens]UAY12039.1 alpha/beta hydrolase [Ensifer adhaerens]